MYAVPISVDGSYDVLVATSNGSVPDSSRLQRGKCRDRPTSIQPFRLSESQQGRLRVSSLTTDKRRIPPFSRGLGRRVNPVHAWLHAMDPDTHPCQIQSHAVPLCKEPGCMNYIL